MATNVTLTVSKVTVLLQNSGMDQLVLQTSLPPPIPNYPGPTDFVTWVTRDKGVEYATANFPGVELEVINARRH